MDSKKVSKTTPKLNDRQIIYSALMEHSPAGITKKKAAELAGYNPKSVYRVEKALSKYSLKHPKRLKKASKVVDAFLSGKSVGESDPPTPAVIRATAEMIYDRFEPVIKTEPVSSQSISFTQVHINTAFINSDEPVRSSVGVEDKPHMPIDITPVLPAEVGEDRDKQGITGNDNE